MIDRAVLDEILRDHGISRERLAALKIKLGEGRSRFLGPKVQVLGIYFALECEEKEVFLFDPPPPRYGREETVFLYPEEINGCRDKSLSGVLAHECGHAIAGIGRKSINPFYLLYRYLPIWCDRVLFFAGAVLFFVCTPILSRAVMGKLAGLGWVGLLLIVFVIMLPLLCGIGYRCSPNEAAAREKATELLADPRWEQVISSDS